MPEFRNEFSWSKSRHEKFAECRRAYYYQYYGSWGGWEIQAETSIRELYVLKKLSTRWQWAGSLVHDTIRRMLRRARATGQFGPVEEILDATRQRARAQWSTSREKSYWRESSGISGLVEHEYGEPVANAEWKRVYDEVIEGSLRAFYGSSVLARIRETPAERWLAVDELDSWSFEGTKIWVALDFAFRDQEGRTQILDWKTGKERHVDQTQLGIYALYAQQKWGVLPEQIVGGLVYLAAGAEPASVNGGALALGQCEQEMRQSIGTMRGVLENPAENRAHMEAFPQRENREACKRCAFRRPCGRI